MMYLRPGNLFKDFEVVRVVNRIKNGTPVEGQERTGNVIRGCLEAADPEDKVRWDQPQHPVTHAIVQRGAPQAEAGWILMGEGKSYRINGVDPCGGLGAATVYYAEERGDSGA